MGPGPPPRRLPVGGLRGRHPLDATIKAAAGRAGDAFAGHSICDTSPWRHAVSIMYLSQSSHPTATGQADGYLPAFSRALAS